MRSKIPWLSIIIYTLAALFLCYEMSLQAAIGVMTHELMQAFSITAKGVGWIHAGYFIAYTLMQIPAGVLFDRMCARNLICCAILCCAFGNLMFATGHTAWVAVIGRFFEGFGSAFAFIGTLVVAAEWFESRWFAFLVGIAQALAAIGAMSAGAPLALAIAKWGWRHTLITLSLIGILLTALVWIMMKNRSAWPQSQQKKINKDAPWCNVLKVIRDPQILWIALYAFCSWAPVTIFAELWGENFLVENFSIKMPHAGMMIGMIWLGLTLVSPPLGWMSERLNNRRYLTIFTALVGICSTLVMLYWTQIEWLSWLCLFGFGFAASGQILSFVMAKDIEPNDLVGTSIGFMNMAVVAGGALLGPLSSYLLHFHWSGSKVQGVPHYLLGDYHAALWIIPLCYCIAMLTAKFCIRETHPLSPLKGSI